MKKLLKSIIIIAITFVLLIPTSVFAQEGSRNMMEEYCLKNSQDDPQCENYVPKKMEQTKIEPPKANNPFEELIQFILQIFQSINPGETVKGATKELSLDSVQNTLENTVDGISNSIPIKLDAKSGNVETKSTNTSEKIPTRSYPTVSAFVESTPVDFTIQNVSVQNSEYYKIITIDMLMTSHLKLDEQFWFSPTTLWMLKSGGEVYVEKCHGMQSDIMTIRGDANQNITWSFCFHVEHEKNNFDLVYVKTKIGTIILD
jgi:hypothetical protein